MDRAVIKSKSFKKVSLVRLQMRSLSLDWRDENEHKALDRPSWESENLIGRRGSKPHTGQRCCRPCTAKRSFSHLSGVLEKICFSSLSD